MGNDEREKILQKIKKLLTLANNEGATPAEAATAAQKAQELLLKYSLTEQDVEGLREPSSYVMKNITFCTVAVRLQAYQSALSVAVKASMCRHVLTSKARTVPATVAIIGTEAQTEVAEYLFRYLSDTLWTMASSQMPKSYRMMNQFTQNRFKYTFVVAALPEIAIRLKDPLEKARNDDSTRALMVVNEQMLEEATNRFFPRLVMTKATTRSLSAIAVGMGREAGKNIPLSKGVKDSQQPSVPMLP